MPRDIAKSDGPILSSVPAEPLDNAGHCAHADVLTMSEGPISPAASQTDATQPPPSSDALTDAATLPALPPDALDQALRLHMAGEVGRANTLYDAILARTPRNADVLHLSGLCLLTAGEPARAADRLRESVDIAPHQPAAHVGLGRALKALGQIDEAMACFDRAMSADPRYFAAWMERGIALVELDRVHEGLADFDRAIALEPTNPGALSNRGDALRRLRRFDESLACFDHALAIDPVNIDVLLNRSAALRDARRNAEALECVERILSVDPDNVPALNNQGNAQVNLRRYQEAVRSFERAIELDPGFIAAWINLANALVTLGRHDDAKAASDHALSLAPNSPAAHWNAALLDLRAGRYATGWERYQVRWLMSGFGSRRHTHLPLWLGKEDLRGKRIVLWQEQGLGDTIQFCRYAIMVASLGAAVVLEVQPSLKALMAQSLRGIAQVIATGEPGPHCDFATPLMSLPLAFETDANTIPFAPSYLRADEARVRVWAERLGPANGRCRIGLAYTGNPKHKGDAERSLDLGMLASLTSEADFCVVQKDARPGDQATLDAHPEIRHFGSMLGDFSETAALVANLDLVISVDTSLAHLAGALGKPVWILLPKHADWRWQLERDDSPWYPSAKLFRQRKAGGWDDVVTRVREALGVFSAERHAAMPDRSIHDAHQTDGQGHDR